MNAYAKARKIGVLMEGIARIDSLVDPDLKLRGLLLAELSKLAERKEEVDEETGEIR